MRRRDFLGAVTAAAMARPSDTNVLVIISDQYFHNAMSGAGHPVVRTPNLDRLMHEGVRFENAVCPTPFCSPSRASIMTGLYPHTHGITSNVRDAERGLDPKLFSTDAALAGAGYTLAQRGKWHLGDKGRIPGYRGDPDTESEKLRVRRRQHITTAEVVKKALAKADASIAIGKTDVPIDETYETHVCNLALEQLQKMAAKPFFLTVSFPAPHAPWVVNDPYYSMYDRSRIPLPANRSSVEPVDAENQSRTLGQLLGDEGLREYLAVYWGMCSMVDAQIGRLLQALSRLKVEQNTLVIFVSDHGDMQAGHGM
jgi:arylsulfatase A-like enzyme